MAPNLACYLVERAAMVRLVFFWGGGGNQLPGCMGVVVFLNEEAYFMYGFVAHVYCVPPTPLAHHWRSLAHHWRSLRIVGGLTVDMVIANLLQMTGVSNIVPTDDRTVKHRSHQEVGLEIVVSFSQSCDFQSSEGEHCHIRSFHVLQKHRLRRVWVNSCWRLLAVQGLLPQLMRQSQVQGDEALDSILGNLCSVLIMYKVKREEVLACLAAYPPFLQCDPFRARNEVRRCAQLMVARHPSDGGPCPVPAH